MVSFLVRTGHMNCNHAWFHSWYWPHEVEAWFHSWYWPHEVETWFHSWYRGKVEMLNTNMARPVHKGMKPFTRCMHNTNPLLNITLIRIFGVYIFISDKWDPLSGCFKVLQSASGKLERMLNNAHPHHNCPIYSLSYSLSYTPG